MTPAERKARSRLIEKHTKLAEAAGWRRIYPELPIAYYEAPDGRLRRLWADGRVD